MNRCIVDRVEGSFAVCEFDEKRMRNLPLEELPDGVGEGDCLRFEDGRWIPDDGEAERRKARVSGLASALFVD